MSKTCVCLICYKPNDIWIDFLSKFTKYDVYICIDDNSKNYNEYYSKQSAELRRNILGDSVAISVSIPNTDNIHIIQITNEECIKKGFTNMNFIMKKMVTSWEKSIYYFSTINTDYDNVWFFEDDVFFYNEETLLRIDQSNTSSDLLSASYTENATGHKNDWNWPNIDIRIPPPYYSAMVCGVRISSNLLSKLRNYANEYKTLFFLEALFPTICKVNNLKYDTPIEFETILYRKDYKDEDIDKYSLFHPVKDLTKHRHYRAMSRILTF